MFWWQLTLMTCRRRHAALTGLFLGLALLAKFTAVLLIPILLLQAVVWLTLARRWRRHGLCTFGRLALAGVTAVVMISLPYRFEGVFRPLKADEYRSNLVTALQKLPVVRSKQIVVKTTC